jgi:hypothetical protein
MRMTRPGTSTAYRRTLAQSHAAAAAQELAADQHEHNLAVEAAGYARNCRFAGVRRDPPTCDSLAVTLAVKLSPA